MFEFFLLYIFWWFSVDAESAKLDLDAFQKAESEHMEISEEFHVAEAVHSPLY